jgi:hypothetical protein
MPAKVVERREVSHGLTDFEHLQCARWVRGRLRVREAVVNQQQPTGCEDPPTFVEIDHSSCERRVETERERERQRDERSREGE